MNEEHITSTCPSSCRRTKIEEFDKFNYRGQKASTKIMKYNTCFFQSKSLVGIDDKLYFRVTKMWKTVQLIFLKKSLLLIPKPKITNVTVWTEAQQSVEIWLAQKILVMKSFSQKKFNSLNVTQVPKLNDTVPVFLSPGLRRTKSCIYLVHFVETHSVAQRTT